MAESGRRSGSVQLLVAGEVVDRGLAEVRLFNNQAWEASILLEGGGAWSAAGQSGHFATMNGHRYNLRSDGTGIVTVCRQQGMDMGYDRTHSEAMTIHVTSWDWSPPPV